MKTFAFLLIAALGLNGCATSESGDTSTNPPAPVTPIIRPNVAYYGNVGSMDSAGKSVAARMLYIMAADSSIVMYVAPASLPLYHPASTLELLRAHGRWKSGNFISKGTITFTLDSTKSFFKSVSPIRSGSLEISADFFYPNTRYAVMHFLSLNEGIMAKGEYAVSHTDTNMTLQSALWQ